MLVADGVCPGHFLGKFHIAPSERKVRRVEYSSSTDANNAGDLRLKEIAQKAAERDQRSLSSLVEKLLTEYCEKIGLIKPSK